MGAETSRVEEIDSTCGSRLTKGIPRVARTNLIAKWRKRQLPTQLFAVARHVERADGLYATVQGGERWTQTKDFQQWPLDPPISDGGMEEAHVLGQKMRGAVEEMASAIHVVICSPYFRCVQTAVEICRELGQQVQLLIDRELGEVFGPQIMGHNEPVFPVRPLEHTRAYCCSRGVTCHSKLIGKWPSWPEDLKSARHRYANRFLTYLQRSSVTRRNFILVTHADCVGAALSMMPSHVDNAVQSVEFGGTFVAKRVRHDSSPAARGRRKSLPTNFASVLPGRVELEDCDVPDAVCEDWDAQSDPLASPKADSWLQDSGSATNQGGDVASGFSDMPVELPDASDGWQVHTHQINLCQKVESSTSKDTGSSRFNKRVKTLAKNSSFSKNRITKLLGELSERTLGGEDLSDNKLDRGEEQRDAGPAYNGHRVKTVGSLPSNVSFSTFLFGSSDVANMSDCGSSHLSPAPSYRMHELEDLIKSQPHSPRSPNLDRTSARRWSDSSLSLPRLSDSCDSAKDLGRPSQESSSPSDGLLDRKSFSSNGNEDSFNSDLAPSSGMHTAFHGKVKKYLRLRCAHDSVEPAVGSAASERVDGPKPVGEQTKAANHVFVVESSKKVGSERRAVPLKSFDGSVLLRRRNMKLNIQMDSTEVSSQSSMLQEHDSSHSRAQMAQKGEPCQALSNNVEPVKTKFTWADKSADTAGRDNANSADLVDDAKPLRISSKPSTSKDSSISALLDTRSSEAGLSSNVPQVNTSNHMTHLQANLEHVNTKFTHAHGSTDRLNDDSFQLGKSQKHIEDKSNSVKPLIVDGQKSFRNEDKAAPFKSLDGSTLMQRRNMKLSLQTGPPSIGLPSDIVQKDS